MNEYMNEYMKETNEALLHTYNQFPVVLDHGEGAYLYDTEGKKYLDFAAGYAVSSLGYGNQELNEALKAQIDKLFHTSNLYYNTVCGKAAEDLKRITGMDRIFFTNSGGEAVEGTLKAARKYAYKKGTGRYEFIAKFADPFHKFLCSQIDAAFSLKRLQDNRTCFVCYQCFYTVQIIIFCK